MHTAEASLRLSALSPQPLLHTTSRAFRFEVSDEEAFVLARRNPS